MVKYRLSKNVQIVTVNNDTYDDVPGKYLHGHYVLYDGARDREFLINDTVKYFIDKFETPKTEAEILQEVEKDVQANSTEIEKTCSEFFKFLSKRKIVVPEDHKEMVLIETPLFKEGDVMDNVTIVKTLSKRDTIDIYLASDITDGSSSVIKLLDRNKTPDKSSYEDELFELEREYLMLQNTKHIPFINKAYAFNKKNDRFAYIQLEYINGKSLSRFLDETAGLTEEDCMSIIFQILQAFSSLHKTKIVHGDVHSSNILISEEKAVKVIDLGMSTNLESEGNEVVKFGGVDFYMPPERINIKSLKKYSKKPDLYSDVYQVGLLMYITLYKDLPLKGFIWEELANNIKEGNIVYPENSFLHHPVPIKLVEIIKKCLHLLPGERYPNATEILKDFERYVLKEKEQQVK